VGGRYLAELESQDRIGHAEGLLVREAQPLGGLGEGGILHQLKVPELDLVIGRH
jgi:hypothetical protein